MSESMTLAAPIEVSGTGLHTGVTVRALLQPAAAGAGVRFRPAGEKDHPGIPGCASHVVGTRLATTLGDETWQVSTVEHLMGTLLGLGVDDLDIVVDGPELPVLDGSAQSWIEAIGAVGLVAQGSPRRVLAVRKPIEVRDGERLARLVPCDGLEVAVRIVFPHPAVGEQSMSLVVDADSFVREIGWARTFGFLKDVKALRRMGLALGGSLENVLVFGPDGIMNPEGMRGPGEPVRHKILDILGDLALVGMPLMARCEAELPGHGLTHALVNALLAQPDHAEVVHC